MQFIANDPAYNALMMTLDRDRAERLRSTSRALRQRSAELIVGSRQLRLRCQRLSQRTADVLRAYGQHPV